MTVDSWETLNETREEALDAVGRAADVGFTLRALVLAVLYVGDCIRALGDRERV